MSHPKNSAGKLLSPANSTHRNLGIALFGDAVETKQQERLLKFVGMFDDYAFDKSKARSVSMPHMAREWRRTFGPLLFRALLSMDVQPFSDFVTAIEAAKRIRKEGRPVQELHAAIIRITSQRERRGEPKLDIQELTNELCDILPGGTDTAQVYRACAVLGAKYAPNRFGPIADGDDVGVSCRKYETTGDEEQK